MTSTDRTDHTARSDGDEGLWASELAEVQRRRELSLALGGEENVARQHATGRLTVRERLDLLLDPDSFREVGQLTGVPHYSDDGQELVAVTPSMCVVGLGEIGGRKVLVGGDDFTVRGGAADAAIFEKIMYPDRMAGELNLPVVRMVDGTGGGGSVRAYEKSTAVTSPSPIPFWDRIVSLLGRVPVVAMCLGPVAGIGAVRVTTSHYSIMLRGSSQLFVAGPPLTRYLGEDVTKEELGGADIHTRNGVIDDAVDSEAEAFARVRQFLSYLPPSAFELPPLAPSEDPIDRREDWLLSAIPREPRRAYKVRPIIEAIVDRGSFFEMTRSFGRSVVTGLARFGGIPVALFASDPYHDGGGWNAATCEKVMRFVDFADTFHLPLVKFADVPGLLIGSRAERAGTARYGARTLAALHQLTIPSCTVILRRYYGIGGAAHDNTARPSYRFAWPSARWGSLPFEGGIEAAYARDLAAADDPEALRDELRERFARLLSPFPAAETFGVEDIIDPRDTRRLLCEFAQVARQSLRPGLKTRPIRP